MAILHALLERVRPPFSCRANLPYRRYQWRKFDDNGRPPPLRRVFCRLPIAIGTNTAPQRLLKMGLARPSLQYPGLSRVQNCQACACDSNYSCAPGRSCQQTHASLCSTSSGAQYFWCCCPWFFRPSSLLSSCYCERGAINFAARCLLVVLIHTDLWGIR